MVSIGLHPAVSISGEKFGPCLFGLYAALSVGGEKFGPYIFWVFMQHYQ
jgi:hypothetical protein